MSSSLVDTQRFQLFLQLGNDTGQTFEAEGFAFSFTYSDNHISSAIDPLPVSYLHSFGHLIFIISE
jgi:hypothetical protein